MKSSKISACLDRVRMIDELNELYDLSERVDVLVMKLRNERTIADHSALSGFQAIICRLETAAQILRSLNS